MHMYTVVVMVSGSNLYTDKNVHWCRLLVKDVLFLFQYAIRFDCLLAGYMPITLSNINCIGRNTNNIEMHTFFS